MQSLGKIPNIQFIHFLKSYLRVYRLLKRLCRILTSLRQDDPSPSRMLYHKFWDIVDPILYYDPAISHLNVLTDLLPAELGHDYKVINNGE